MHSNSIKQKSIKQKLKKLSEEADAKELRAQILIKMKQLKTMEIFCVL